MSKRFNISKIKLASFDIDGTIFENEQMSEKVSKSLTLLSSKGIIMALSTGRGRHIIPHCVEELGIFSYGVLGNGTVVYDFESETEIYSVSFDKDVAIKALEVVSGITDKYYVAFRNYSLLTARIRELFCQQGKIVVDSQIHILHDDQIDFIKNSSNDVYKIGCFFDDQESCSRASKLLTEQQYKLECTAIGDTELEFVPKGINKAKGMMVLSDHLNINFENIISFGDNGNDVELLKMAGFSVVVGNGVQAALDVADYIAPSVYEDGVAIAIEDLFGIFVGDYDQ